MTGAEIIHRCRELARYTEEPGRITRTFLSPPMHEVHRLVRGWMEAAGLRVRVDAAGNIRGLRGAGPRLMIGSHLDTVPDAGAFDGILGVMIGIALAARRPDCAVEVIGFSDEEGARFGIPFIGSRAVAGDPVTEPAVIEAIREFGLDPAGDAVADIGGYLEFHIEQGPALESLSLPVGVVEGIAGQTRAEVRFTGRAAHAGTTPMHLRTDALAGAAEWIGAVTREACTTSGLVATVGKLQVEPGAVNVIPGSAAASLDVRHARDEVRRRAVAKMRSAAEEIAAQRGLAAAWEVRMDQAAVALDFAPMERAVAAAGLPVHRMTSGAGHDAMILARKCPTSMLFLRSPGGVSHHPDESALPEDVEAALAVGERFLAAWRPE